MSAIQQGDTSVSAIEQIVGDDATEDVVDVEDVEGMSRFELGASAFGGGAMNVPCSFGSTQNGQALAAKPANVSSDHCCFLVFPMHVCIFSFALFSQPQWQDWRL